MKSTKQTRVSKEGADQRAGDKTCRELDKLNLVIGEGRSNAKQIPLIHSLTKQVKELNKGKQTASLYSFDTKERSKGYKCFVAWLDDRSLSEKQTAIALLALLCKQEYLPDEHLGDKLNKQWREEVLNTVSTGDKTICPEDENFFRGFLTALVTFNG